ncbi:MAG TPA: CBS domain-containing protein [Kofleriaceae bacterium]|jgi:CBS domain-containing protein
MRRLERTIEEIGWSHDVPRLSADEPVSRAFSLMSGERADCVLVLDGEALVGIFTSRDYLDRVAAIRGNPRELRMRDVMTPSPRSLRPRDCVAFAVNYMAVENYRNVPIVDDDGHPLGVLAIWDVMRHLQEIFDDIEAAPRFVAPIGDESGVVSMVDLGGDA